MGTFLKLQPRKVEIFTNREADVMRLIAKGCQAPRGHGTHHNVHVPHPTPTANFAFHRAPKPHWGPRGAGWLTLAQPGT